MLTEKATAGYLAAILQEKNVSEKFDFVNHFYLFFTSVFHA